MYHESNMSLSGIADRDVAAMMILNHQSAAGMAQVVPQHGRAGGAALCRWRHPRPGMRDYSGADHADPPAGPHSQPVIHDHFAPDLHDGGQPMET